MDSPFSKSDKITYHKHSDTKMCCFCFIEKFLFTEGHCWGLDVRFEDPTTGFFLRDSNLVSSVASTLDTSASPTTSIILGTNEIKPKEAQEDHGTSLEDILHTER